jgi:protein-disulfide isomerase
MSDSLRIEQDDHLRGARDAQVTLVEYADFQCPYCARAHAALTELMGQHGGRVALVYRHLPLEDLHPFAAAAAQAAEAALPALASKLGLDAQRFASELTDGTYRARVERQAEQARALGASGTPTFFINGERYHGDSDHASLAAALKKALGEG